MNPIEKIKYLGLRRYILHLVAKALRLHAKIENGQPIGICKPNSGEPLCGLEGNP